MAENEKLDWFPLYVYEFITDIAGWYNIEVGIYFRLLCFQWIDGYLPGDLERLARLANEPYDSFIKAWQTIGKKFTIQDKKYYNLKLEKIRKQQQKFIEKKSEAGSEGARARWNKFIKPNIEEIKSFCLERKNNIDAEAFFNFYESKDWMIGKNKMKKWKSAIITWEKGNKSTAKTNVYIRPKKIEIDPDYAAKYYNKQGKDQRSGETGLGSELKKKMEQIVSKNQ